MLYFADIIFVIYLYQRWMYPVDKSRVNEYGFGGDEKKEVEPSPSESEGLADVSEESKKSK